MDAQKKKSLALTLIGHGVVLMAVFLGAAFVHRPKLEYMMLDFGLGGPKNLPLDGGRLAPPQEPQEEPPQPPAKAKEQAPEEPEPEKSEFATQKKPPPKKAVKQIKPAPKPAPKKKTVKKPAVQKSKKTVVRSASAKPSAKSASKGESASDIRRRMEERIGRSNGSSDSTGPAGDGSGNASGTSNRFAAYLGGLEEQIQVAWEQPSSAAAGLVTEVKFHLEKSGDLTGIRISKSSGNADMDQSAMLAVKSVLKYEPWPADFPPDLAEILVDFECKPNQ
jgi:TonB family protein